MLKRPHLEHSEIENELERYTSDVKKEIDRCTSDIRSAFNQRSSDIGDAIDRLQKKSVDPIHVIICMMLFFAIAIIASTLV